MKTMAAVLTEVGKPYEIVELELDGPKAGEVLVRWVAAGLCHSDLHLQTGSIPSRMPIVGGHEGAGVVEEVGAGVTRVRPGDHVLASFMPACGHCPYCVTGRQNLCDQGEFLLDGQLADGTFRFHLGAEDAGGMCSVGSFSERATVSGASVVKIDQSLPLKSAVVVSCGVPTGWGTAVKIANIQIGDTTVIYGAGGVGMNAVQGAAAAGAKNIVVVDPHQLKRDTALKFGATHAFADPVAAHDAVVEMTQGRLADHALILAGLVDETVIQQAFAVIGKGATVVITGASPMEEPTIHVSGAELTFWQKNIKGSNFGGCNPLYDIPKLLDLWQTGQLKVEELISREYGLEEVNQGYQDMLDGNIIRGVITFEA